MRRYNIFCKKHPPGNVIVYNLAFRLNNSGSTKIILKEEIPISATYKSSLGNASSGIEIYVPPAFSDKTVYANAEAALAIGTLPPGLMGQVFAEGESGLLLQAALSTVIYVDIDEKFVIDAAGAGIIKRYRYLYETDDKTFLDFDDMTLEDFDYVILEE